MIAIIFTFIYLVSFGIHLIICYQDWRPRNIGALIDKIEFYMWFPIVNTTLIIAVILAISVVKIWKLFKLDILWEKFRNIKLP
jgi:hypothetical protein